ncbi:TetR/AcrR family transcriptional regulator [Micromonospora zhanjiangensis]
MATTVPPLGRTPLPGAREGRDPDRVIKRGPRRLPAEVVAATQRDRLYDGLVHTVAAKGYDNARVSDICQAAGVTRPAFYAQFEGKEAAFLATYRHGTTVVVRLMQAAYRDEGDWRSGARGALKVLLDVLAGVPAFATMAVVEGDAAGPAARRERDRLLAEFRQFFGGARPLPPLAVPHDVLIDSIVGGIYATIRQQVAAGAVQRLPELLPVLTYFMVAPFLGPAEAAREAAAVDQGGVVTVAPCVRRPTDTH